jgi:hypothetical protein
MYRSVRKVDANHKAILGAARGVGATVVDTHILGRGEPDAIVIFRGRTFLLELKTGREQPNTLEKAYALACREPVHVIRTVDEMLTLIGAQ